MSDETGPTCATCGAALDGVTPGRFNCGATEGKAGKPCPEANRLAVYRLDALALANIFSTGKSSVLNIGAGIPKLGRLVGGKVSGHHVELLVWAMSHDLADVSAPLPTFDVLTRDSEPSATVIPFGKGARPS